MKLAVTYLKYCAMGVIGRRSAWCRRNQLSSGTKINAMLTPIEEWCGSQPRNTSMWLQKFHGRKCYLATIA